MNYVSAVQVTVTPTLDTSAYTSGDRLGSIFTIAGAASSSGGLVELTDLLIIDSATQSQAIDVLIFSQSPTVASADNAAIDISDSELAGKLQGSISVAAASYKATASNSYVTASNLGVFAKPVALSPQGTSYDLYGLLICRSGTPTYAASSLKLVFKFKQY